MKTRYLIQHEVNGVWESWTVSSETESPRELALDTERDAILVCYALHRATGANTSYVTQVSGCAYPSSFGCVNPVTIAGRDMCEPHHTMTVNGHDHVGLPIGATNVRFR